MSSSKPFPLSVDLIPVIKSTLGLTSDAEAATLDTFRRFLDVTVSRKPDTDQEDREIVYGDIKVKVSILRPRGSKDEVLPVILFM
jgi:hypothetical protein